LIAIQKAGIVRPSSVLAAGLSAPGPNAVKLRVMAAHFGAACLHFPKALF
jgi:hypothetical protein